MDKTQEYCNGLRTMPDESGQTYEQRHARFQKAWHALVHHPALDETRQYMLASTFAALIHEIEMITWFPSADFDDKLPHDVAEHQLDIAFWRVIRHPDTSKELKRFFLTVGRELRGAKRSIAANKCPNCDRPWPVETQGGDSE